MRSKLESRLAAARAEAADRAAAERERRLATKYHRVRFFERVKAERALRRARDRLGKFLAASANANAAAAAVASAEGEAGNEEGDEGERLAALESAVDAAEDDLVYITHFPKGERYVSLFRGVEEGDGGGGGGSGGEKVDAEALARIQKERLRLRKLARARTAEEALVGEADEGRGLVRKKEKRRAEEEGEEEEEEEEEEDDDFLLPAASVPEKKKEKKEKSKAVAAAAAALPAPAAKKRALSAASSQIASGSD